MGAKKKAEPEPLPAKTIALNEAAARLLADTSFRGRAREVRAQLDAAELEMHADRLLTAARWSHKNAGTARTHHLASTAKQGPLARLFMAGDIDADQLAWAVEIAMVAEMIERDVDPGIVSYEPRIDCSASSRNVLVEGIIRVRREVAYTYWRGWLPAPKRMVLDMIVGDPVPFSTAARKFGTGHRKALRLLVEALDRWPQAMERAEHDVDDASLEAARAGLL